MFQTRMAAETALSDSQEGPIVELIRGFREGGRLWIQPQACAASPRTIIVIVVVRLGIHGKFNYNRG